MTDAAAIDRARLSQVGPEPWPPGTAPPDPGTLPALLDTLAGTSGERLAVCCGDERVTYTELGNRSQRAAAVLEHMGVGPGDAVALLAPNSVDWLVIAIAVVRRGAVLHAFNTWVRPAELDYLLRASRATVLLTVAEFAGTDFIGMVDQLVPEARRAGVGILAAPRYPELRRVVALGHEDRGLPTRGAAATGEPELTAADLSAPSDPAVVVYTSGSTRAPKAVPLVQRMMIDNGFAIGERMRLTADDRVWLASPLFWSYGIANAVMATFTHRAALVLERKFDASAAAATLRRENCTAAYLLPTMVDALCTDTADAVRAVEPLRTGLTIGRPDDVRRVVEELGVPGICNVYGLTEVYGNCCVTDAEDPLELRLTSQGRPLPGVQLRVVDDVGALLPLGVLGQIEVRGRVMSGYLPGVEEEIESPFTVDGWFRTGDTGLLRDDGRLEFVGRHSEMIKTAGINVSPAEIEATLRTVPGVLEAAVVGVPDRARGEVAVAFVVTAEPLNEAALIGHCRDLMSSYKVPRRVHLVDALPLTATGKLSRKSLVELASDPSDPV